MRINEAKTGANFKLKAQPDGSFVSRNTAKASLVIEMGAGMGIPFLQSALPFLFVEATA